MAASLDYAFFIKLKLLFIRKILFQTTKRKCTFTTEMQVKHPSIHVLKTGRNDYEAECLVCKLLRVALPIL